MDAVQLMQYDAGKKSQGVALALWLFLAPFGAHRFYLGKTGTAILQILLLVSIVGSPFLVVWLTIDLFRLFPMTEAYNKGLAASILAPRAGE